MGTTERDYASYDLTKRPDEEVLEIFRQTPPTFVSDYLKQIGIVNHTIRGVTPLAPFPNYKEPMVGPAITMRMVPVTESYSYIDAPYLHTEIVERADPGDVLVIAAGGAPYGFWGDHTTHEALKQEMSGVVIDGFSRDSRPIIESGLTVYSAGTTPESYVRRYDPVGYNVAVNAGGAMVRAGDLIVGDDDGVVVVPIEVIERVAEGVQMIARAEDQLREAITSNKPWEQIYYEIHHTKYLEHEEENA